jgi:hypothetical protein
MRAISVPCTRKLSEYLLPTGQIFRALSQSALDLRKKQKKRDRKNKTLKKEKQNFLAFLTVIKSSLKKALPL